MTKDNQQSLMIDKHDEKAFIEVQPQALQPAEPSIMQMIDYCVRNQGSIEVMEKLVAMRDRDRAYTAKRAFDDAMEAAQAEISTVVADAYNEQTKRKYASFKALNDAIRPKYLAQGFSLSFTAEPSPNAGEIYVVCNVSHSGGHTQRYMTPMAVDPNGPKGGGVMNKMQAHSAALSYGRSALLKIIFNIAIDEKGAEPERLDDLNERLENMRDGDRASLDKVYADNWAAAVKINDLRSLFEFIKMRVRLCSTPNELNAIGKAAFEGVAAFKNEGLSKAVTAQINARKGELLK